MKPCYNWITHEARNVDGLLASRADAERGTRPGFYRANGQLTACRRRSCGERQ